MRVLRTTKGITLRDKVRSDIIKRECEIDDIERWVRRPLKRWHESWTSTSQET